jgi:hypothetical protein
MLNENFLMGAAENFWISLLKLNLELFNEKNLQLAKFLIEKIPNCDQHKNIDSTFCLDGYSAECIFDLSQELLDKKNLVKIPPKLKNQGNILFYNRGEGWGLDCVFDGIHNIIKLCNLEGNIIYSNHSYNLNDVYLKYCKKRKIKPILKCHYNGGFSFHNLDSQFYSIPNSWNAVSTNEKKLYCSFNWNAWTHRLGLIALLHYYDLLQDGYVTSPGSMKFSYNRYADFLLLQNGCREYIDCYFDRNQIYNKLETLKPNYPLRIDDRTKYTNTDEPLYDIDLKKPLFESRINSFFEIIAETRFNGEHFFSEKTYTPIRLGKPFLMMTSVNALKSLRAIGYKTFSPFIDESYDNEKNDAIRLLKIVKELKRLQNLKNNNFKDFLKIVENCNNIAQYNLEMFVLLANRATNHNTNIEPYLRMMHVNL